MSRRIVLIIQARMGSTRLPGKSLMDLAGAPLVGRILERVKRCQSFDEIVLAVPNTAADRPLVMLGKAYGVTVYAGSEDNLVDRYYQAACLAKADIVARLPADNIAPEPSEIDRMVQHHYLGFSSNLSEINGSGYPDGIGVEVFDFTLLDEIRQKDLDLIKREHVHRNFFDYTTQRPVDEVWCPINTIPCSKEFRRPDLILDVNTKEQYYYARALYEYLYPKNPTFHITDIIRWHDEIWMSNKFQSELTCCKESLL